jgi:hypothetical protein
METRDANVGIFSGGFETVNDEVVGLSISVQEMPMEGGDLGASTGGLFNLCNQPATCNLLEVGGVQPQEERADDNNDEHQEKEKAPESVNGPVDTAMEEKTGKVHGRGPPVVAIGAAAGVEV